MTKKKVPQAPKGKWRYGIVKRTYKTVFETSPKKLSFTESFFELVEVYDQGRSYTGVTVDISAEGKAGLIRALESALAAAKKYDVIVEKKVIVHRIGSTGKVKK